MSQKLKNKSAVVTGAGSGGIGRAVAIALAEEGAKVVVNDIARDEKGVSLADKVVAEIKKAKGTAVASYDSVATMKGGESIIKTCVDSFGGINILVNCAGNYIRAGSADITEKQWDSIIDVHLKGHFACAKAAMPYMIEQKSGRIINFSSRAASGGGGNLAYSTAKAGILGFTSALSADLKPYNIAVNAIVPSADTKLFPGMRPRAAYENMPFPLWLEPDYVAPMVAYLATDEAAPITGRFIYACGGDLCIYAAPLKLPGEAHIFIRKLGKWTLDDLSKVMLPTLGLD